MFLLNVESENHGGYFSSEQLEFLSIIQCTTHEELILFVKQCMQLYGVFSSEELEALYMDGIDDAKRKVFRAYQDTLVAHNSEKDAALENLLYRLNLKQDEIDTIKIIYQNNNKESLDHIKEFIKEKYPNNYESIFTAIHKIISVERDQNKDPNLYDEFALINEQLYHFNTLLVGSGRPEIIINKLYNIDSDNMLDFYFTERDLNFAYKNNKHIRLHSLLTKAACEEFFVGKSKEEVIEILTFYVKHTIDFVNNYNKTHRLSDGSPVINSIDLFNEIISFDKNEYGEYENIWEKNYGISIQELCTVFKYAQDNKPAGVDYLYNEPFLEDTDRRKKVIETLNEINNYSRGLIDTLGSQMHITFSTSDEQIKDCFSDFERLQANQNIKIQITEFDLSLSEKETLMLIGDNPKFSYEQVYQEKTKRLNSISSIINDSGVKLSGITYWSLTDKVDCNLQRVRSNLLKKHIIKNINEVPNTCGGLIPTSQQYINSNNIDQNSNGLINLTPELDEIFRNIIITSHYSSGELVTIYSDIPKYQEQIGILEYRPLQLIERVRQLRLVDQQSNDEMFFKTVIFDYSKKVIDKIKEDYAQILTPKIIERLDKFSISIINDPNGSGDISAHPNTGEIIINMAQFATDEKDLVNKIVRAMGTMPHELFHFIYRILKEEENCDERMVYELKDDDTATCFGMVGHMLHEGFAEKLSIEFCIRNNIYYSISPKYIQFVELCNYIMKINPNINEEFLINNNYEGILEFFSDEAKEKYREAERIEYLENFELKTKNDKYRKVGLHEVTSCYNEKTFPKSKNK